jgi:hypothetical protein
MTGTNPAWRLATAARKRLAAARHDAVAAQLRADADALEAEYKSRCTPARPGKDAAA